MKTKTNTKRNSGLKNRSDITEQPSQDTNSNSQAPVTPTATATTTPTAPAPNSPEQSEVPTPRETNNSTKSTRPYVNFAEREFNRTLSTDKVLAVLKRWMPRQYELAEVVGKWIWITFPEQPVEHVRADLSQLGFHWNNTRKCWQHPCGQTLPRGQEEPRDKYASYHPADRVAA